MPSRRKGKRVKRTSVSHRKPTLRRTAAASRVTVSGVDFDDPAAVASLNKALLKGAAERIHAAVKGQKKANIIDEQGRRIRKQLPPDMQPKSRCRLP